MQLHPALWTLVRLRTRGGVRRLLRELRTVRGAVVFLFAAAILGIAGHSLLDGNPWATSISAERLGELYRSGLLTFVLVGQIKTLGDMAVYFSPSEVDFLFAGPFSRRELLVYRVVSSLGGILVLSAVLTILLASVGGWWPTVLVGGMLSFLFLHLLAMCLATLRETVEAHAFSVGRRIAVLSALTLVVVNILYGVSVHGQGEGPGVLSAAYDSWTMQALLLPFAPFARVVTAGGFDSATLGWIAVCLLVNAGTFLALVGLDAGNLHTAAVLSRRDLNQSQRSTAGVGSGRRDLVSPLSARVPHLKGAGTIASVQLARAVRGYRLLAELAFVVLVIAGAVYLRQGATGSIGHISLSNLVSVTIWTTVVVSNPLRFDFRGDLHNLEYLKTLPMPAWAVCIGQLMTPVFITLLYQMPFLVLASQVLRPALLLAAISLAIPLNVIWYSLENLGFLLYPTGQSGRGLGDVQYLGRQLLMLSVKLCCVAFAALLAVLLGLALAHFVTLDMTAFMVVVAATLVIEALLLVGVLAWVFKRFDPSPLQPSDA